MLTRDFILHKLRASLPDLKLLGITKVALYGSFARGDQHAQSDIDILVEVDYDHFRFSRYNEACDLMEQLFKGQKVSITTKAGLPAKIAALALHDVVYA